MNNFFNPADSPQFTFSGAKEKCPQAENCDHAKVGFCTLADIFSNCAKFRELLLKQKPDALPKDGSD